MLCFFTSVEYLQELHKAVTDLLNGIVDPLLDLARFQNRDELFIDPVWGTRNTSQNWADNAWPILKDLQISLATDIAARSSSIFRRTAVNDSLRGVDQFSMDWTTPEEEELFLLAIETIGRAASEYDDCVSEENDNRWNDYYFAYSFPTFAARHDRIPRFRIRPDISADTGMVPPVTGVYIDALDPHAALQFAWTENGGRKLRKANTFNEVGLDALKVVGRDALWFDEEKMFAFATSKKYESRFLKELIIDEDPEPELAPSEVGKVSFTQHPSKWYLVEKIEGYDPLNPTETPVPAAAETHRIVGGERCVVEGYYFTPAVSGSRKYFSAGETTPNFDAKYGQTFWQWDANQE